MSHVDRMLKEPIYVGNGILDQIKEPEPIEFKVEDLYESIDPKYWQIVDTMLSDRPDLQDRIKKYKKKNNGKYRRYCISNT